MNIIAENLKTMHHLIEAAEMKYHRLPGSVSLLAVSKKQPLTKIIAAFKAGQTCFGENYVQEALPKMAVLSHEPIEWHFIGPIQANKTRKIAEHFAWVHSVADRKVAQRLNEQRPAHLPSLNICIEVNVDQEATKSGIAVEEVIDFAQFCETLPRLKLRGLMTIPAPQKNFTEQRQSFEILQILLLNLRQKNILVDTLSMGMSDDFSAAIAAGATIVRIGTAIFGERQ